MRLLLSVLSSLIFLVPSAVLWCDPVAEFTNNHNLFICKSDKSLGYLTPYGERSFTMAQQAQVNGQPSANPLDQKDVKLLAMIKEQPVIVCQENPDSVYFVTDNPGDRTVLISTSTINDAGNAQGEVNPIKSIEALSFAASGTEENVTNDYLFLAVTGTNAAFGEISSGIAVVALAKEFSFIEKLSQRTKKMEKEKYLSGFHFASLNSVTGSMHNPCAYPIDNRDDASNQFNISGGLEAIGPNPILYWDQSIRRLYIGLSVKTAAHATDKQGACALAVGRLEGNKLCIEPFASHNILAQLPSSIFSCMGAQKECSIKRLNSIKTSTGTLYLVVGLSSGDCDHLYSLPLVDKSNVAEFKEWTIDPSVGKLASCNADLAITHSEGFAFTQEVQTVKDIAKPDDARCTIGGVLPGKILDMQIAGDAVWVALDTQKGFGELFVSYPLFDKQGCIMGWTPWKKGMGNDHPVVRFSYNFFDRSFHLVQKDKDDQLSLRKTEWFTFACLNDIAPTNSYSIAHALVKLFEPSQGGIQGVSFVDQFCSGFQDHQGAGLLIATGLKKVAIAQSSVENATNYFDFKDPVLDQLGPINCSVFVKSAYAVWFCVAGPRGLAILTDENGNGFAIDNNFSTYFTLCQSGLYHWKKIESPSSIKKLIAADGSLYCVCNDSIHRIDFENTAQSRAIMQLNDVVKSAVITDCLIDASSILLGTSKGFFAAKRESDDNNFFTQIELLDSEAVIRLHAVPASGNQGLFSNMSQIYVMVGSQAKGRSFVYRFALKDNELTLVPYNEGNQILLNCKSFRNNLFAEGSILYLIKGVTRAFAPIAQVYQILPPPGYISNAQYTNTHALHVGSPHWTRMHEIIQDTTTGHLIICGDGGFFVRH